MNSLAKDFIICEISCIDWQEPRVNALEQAIKATFDLVVSFEKIGPLMFVNTVIYRNQKIIVMLLKFYQESHNKLFLEQFANFKFNNQLIRIQPALLKITTPPIEYPDLRINIMNQEFVTLYSNTRMHPQRLQLVEIEEKIMQERRALMFPYGLMNHSINHHYGIRNSKAVNTFNSSLASVECDSTQDITSDVFNGNETSSFHSSKASDEDLLVDNEISMINNKPSFYTHQGYSNNNMVFFPSLNYYYYSVY